MQQEREIFFAILQNALHGVVMLDRNGKPLYANPAFISITGYTLKDIPTLRDWMHKAFPDEAYRRKVTEFWEHDKRFGARARTLSIVCKNGETKEMEIRPTILEDGRIVMISTDITERKQAEEALRESDKLNASLLYDSPHPIIVTNPDTSIRHVNNALEKLTGFSATELVGKKAPYPWWTEETVCKTRDDLIKGMRNGAQGMEEHFQKKTGERFVVEITSRSIIHEGILRFFLANWIDVTKRKQAEQALQHSYDELRETFITTVNALASTVEMKDPYTAGHQRRVTRLACAIAKEMNLPEKRIEGIRMAGLIHDIGKINIPAEILAKPGHLSEIQYNMVKIHPQVGYDVLKEIKFPWPVAKIVLQHHERMDGSGYPRRSSGSEIILEARILAVADVVEAMASHRPYRAAHSIEMALDEISSNKGTLYDPDVVDVCLKLFGHGFQFD